MSLTTLLDFAAILDKKGKKPYIPSLDFRTDYRKSDDGPQAYHLEVIALDELDRRTFLLGG